MSEQTITAEQVRAEYQAVTAELEEARERLRTLGQRRTDVLVLADALRRLGSDISVLDDLPTASGTRPLSSTLLERRPTTTLVARLVAAHGEMTRAEIHAAFALEHPEIKFRSLANGVNNAIARGIEHGWLERRGNKAFAATERGRLA